MSECPSCAHPLTLGFGLAAGGYGSYQYCQRCGYVEAGAERNDRSEVLGTPAEKAAL